MERNNVYIGMRYVPKFMGDWDSTMQTAYESLSIVLYNRNTYTSKRPVPVNIPLSNTEYWVMTGFYDGQVARLQEEIDALSARIDAFSTRFDSIDSAIAAINTTVSALTSRVAAAETGIASANSAITALAGRVSTNEGSIVALNNKVGDFKDYEFEFFRGKNILVVGDSLSDPTTQPPNWVTLLKNNLMAHGGNVDTHLCIAGASFQTMYDNELAQFEALNNDYDYIIIELGINDYHMQFGLGDFRSTTVHNSDVTMNTVDSLAAMNVILSKLRARCPKALQYYCPPSRTDHQLEVKRWTPITFYRNSFSRCAMYYGCRIIDFSSMPMFAPAAVGDLNGYTSAVDRVHPSNVYAPILMEYVKQKIMSGGDSDWKDSSNVYGLTNEISEGYVIFGCTSHGMFRIKAALSIDVNVPTITMMHDIPYWFPTHALLCFVNDIPTKIQKIGTDLVLWLPNGVSQGTSLFIEDTMIVDVGVNYENVID